MVRSNNLLNGMEAVMKKVNLFQVVLSIVLMAGCLSAGPRRGYYADAVAIDTGNKLGGFSVSVGTTTPVLLCASANTNDIGYRIRTFQVTGTSYNVWMGTHSAISYGTGAGWYVAGSTGSFTTRSQGAVYGVLDPSAGAGTATIVGPYEYQSGEHPAP
jgi:hypothetical protein